MRPLPSLYDYGIFRVPMLVSQESRIALRYTFVEHEHNISFKSQCAIDSILVPLTLILSASTFHSPYLGLLVDSQVHALGQHSTLGGLPATAHSNSLCPNSCQLKGILGCRAHGTPAVYLLCVPR